MRRGCFDGSNSLYFNLRQRTRNQREARMTPSGTEENKIKISKQIIGKKLAGEEWVFLNLKNGAYYGLNEAGSLFWDELSRDGDLEQAVNRLCRIFDAEPLRIKQDMEVLVRRFKKEGMIE